MVDDNFTLYRQYTIPQHAGFSATEENIAALRESLEQGLRQVQGHLRGARRGRREGGPGGGGPMTSVEFIADDTLEGLAAQLGLTGEAAETFLKTIENYNAYCEAGADRNSGATPEVCSP